MAKPETEREEIPWNMRLDLLFKYSEFQMIPNADNPQQTHFIRPLRFEGLTKNLSMDTIRDNFRRNLYVTWTMMRLFGEVPPQPSEIMYGAAATHHIFRKSENLTTLSSMLKLSSLPMPAKAQLNL